MLEAGTRARISGRECLRYEPGFPHRTAYWRECCRANTRRGCGSEGETVPVSLPGKGHSSGAVVLCCCPTSRWLEGNVPVKPARICNVFESKTSQEEKEDESKGYHPEVYSQTELQIEECSFLKQFVVVTWENPMMCIGAITCIALLSCR